MTSSIFRRTKDVSDHDDGTDGVENVERRLPLQVWVIGLWSGLFAHAVMEDDRGQDKEAEHDDLEKQGAQYDLLTQLKLVRVSTSHDTAAPTLDEE